MKLLLWIFLFSTATYGKSGLSETRLTNGSREVTLKRKGLEIKISEKSGPEDQLDTTIEIRSGQRILSTKKFDKVMAVGGSAGIEHFPAEPLRNYILLAKSGDYDPRLILIHRSGKVFDLPTGEGVFVNAAESLLISLRSSEADGTAYAVFDLKNVQEMMSEAETLPDALDGEDRYRVYTYDGKYFALKSLKSEGSTESKVLVLHIDLKTKKFLPSTRVSSQKILRRGRALREITLNKNGSQKWISPFPLKVSE